jgi:hypothetical protein
MPETKTLDLSSFELQDMLRCGLDIRRSTRGAASVESAASIIVRYLFGTFEDSVEKQRQVALVRFYKTHPYRELDADLRGFARGILGSAPRDEGIKCLTLLATAGVEEEWNDRRRSRGHRAIPLVSPGMVERAPMISGLIRQMGMDVEHLLNTDAAFLQDAEGRTYNIFYVEEALGSPYIPAQEEFVRPFGIRSVVGFGGMIKGELFAIIVFSRIPIARAAASRFRNVALEVKAAIHAIDRVFD